MNSFSNPNDLQSAIEGNKREGRTSSFGPYGGMPLQNSPLPPSLGGMPFSMMGTPPRPLHMNGSRPPMHPGKYHVIDDNDTSLNDCGNKIFICKSRQHQSNN